MNASDFVLKGGVGMQDRLLHVKQRLAEEAITIAASGDDSIGAWINGRHIYSVSIDERSKHQSKHNEYTVNKKQHRKRIISHANSKFYTDQVPVGTPLPKPPTLANHSQKFQCDAASLNTESIGLSSNDEKLTDDESATEKSATVCDSRIYEVSSSPMVTYPSLRTDYKPINPDERIFLEAISCIRSSTNMTGIHSKSLEQAAIHRPTPQRRIVSKNSLHNKALSVVFPTKKECDSGMLLARMSKKRCPIGPPPFTLQKIRKTNLP